MHKLPPPVDWICSASWCPKSPRFWILLIAASLLIINFIPALVFHLAVIWIADVPFSFAAPTSVPCALLCGLSISAFVLVLKKHRLAARLTVATWMLAMTMFIWQVHFGEPDMTTTPIGSSHYEYEKHYFTWWWYVEEVRL